MEEVDKGLFTEGVLFPSPQAGAAEPAAGD
jgi:hypothetical protein